MILAICGQKGGVGKSTAAVSLAAEWHARGLRVLLVDADRQGTARTWGDVAAEAGCPAPVVVAMGPGFHRPDQLPRLAAGYERIVIDCPPRAGEIQRAALAVADVAVLPCGPSAPDVWGLAESLALVQEARTTRPQLRAAVLLARRQSRTALGAGAREALASCGLPVLRAELAWRIAYAEAFAAGVGVTAYAPSSPAAAEVRALATEIDRLAGAPAAKRKRADHA